MPQHPILLPKDSLRPVVVASHPRSGTHLVLDFLRRQFGSFYSWRLWGVPLDHLYLNIERLGAERRRFSDPLARRIVKRPRRALLKTHFLSDFTSSWSREESSPPCMHWRDFIDQAHFIYIVRHPLDVMASCHQFLSGIDPAAAGASLPAFLKSPHWDGSADRVEWWQRHVESWANRDHVTVVKYEDFLKNPRQVIRLFSDVFREVALWRTPELPPKVTSVWRARYNRLFQLSPASTAIVADARRFPAHDWRTQLTAAELSDVGARIGELCARFGYSISESGA